MLTKYYKDYALFESKPKCRETDERTRSLCPRAVSGASWKLKTLHVC